jgi:hypothetical protein
MNFYVLCYLPQCLLHNRYLVKRESEGNNLWYRPSLYQELWSQSSQQVLSSPLRIENRGQKGNAMCPTLSIYSPSSQNLTNPFPFPSAQGGAGQEKAKMPTVQTEKNPTVH